MTRVVLITSRELAADKMSVLTGIFFYGRAPWRSLKTNLRCLDWGHMPPKMI